VPGGGVLDVERCAELRREHFVRGVAIKELVRRTGLARNTIKRALRSDEPPSFRSPGRPSKLDPFKDEIHRLLKLDPKLPGVRVWEEIEPLGFCGGQTIVDDYLREVRPLFLRLRTHQRTVYRPGEICQWEGFYVKFDVVARDAVTAVGDPIWRLVQRAGCGLACCKAI
jgi:hypothetical protein